MDIYNPIKTCPKCGIEKPVSEFNKDKTKKDGLQPHCKFCAKEYRQKNKEKIKEYRKEYNRINVESIKEYNKQYKRINEESLNEQRKVYQKTKRETDPVYKLKGNTRNLIRGYIKRKGYTKQSRTHDILGCDYNTLKEHIEKQFDSNMSWDNQGSYWDIDHIIPLSSANTEEEVLALNHYTNLQPLESYYNRHIKRGNVL